MEQTIGWSDGMIVAVDQRVLPQEYRLLTLGEVDELIEAIRQLAIRGAPAIGVAAGLGVALSARRHTVPGPGPGAGTVNEAAVRADAQRLAAARPTAVNLRWAVDRVLGRLAGGADAMLAEALSMVDENERVNRRAAHRAVELIRQLCPPRRLRILTHCNAGALATGEWGTALGAIRELAAADLVESVLVDETRPLLQGARLTVWELAEAGIAHRLCVDTAGVSAVASGLVDCVIVGADRVAANGDVANKIGTYALACAAARSQVPFLVVAPESTIDPATPDGAAIVIEQRPAEEVTGIAGVPTTVAGTEVYNPAFDVTPNELVTAVLTEARRYPTRGANQYGAAADLAGRLAAVTRVVPDARAPGGAFHDLSGMLGDPALGHDLAAAVAGTYRGQFDMVVVADVARGMPLGAAVAQRARVPLVLAQVPGGRAPWPGGLSGPVRPGDRALVVGEVLATGATLAAVAGLVIAAGARVAGYGVLLELSGLGGRVKIPAGRVLSIRTGQG